MAKRVGPCIENPALLQAVCAEPDADEPRLLYADWLEEQGETARAEHIRLQIRMRLPGLEPSRWQEMSQRHDALERQHGAAWAGQLPTLEGIIWSSTFERGFTARVTARTSAAFRTHADTIFRTAPVRILRILRPGETVELMLMPHLARLTTLILTELRLGPKDADALASSPHLSGLQDLYLSQNRLGDKGAAALARLPYLKNLISLDLSHNRIGPAGVKVLAQSTHLPSLTGLALSGNEIEDEGARALIETVLFRMGLVGLTLWEIYRLSDGVRQQLKKRFGECVSFKD